MMSSAQPFIATTARARALGVSWPLVIGIAAFVLLLGRPELLNDGDIFWHVAMGHWMWEHWSVPLHDFWSHTKYGHAWTPHEWLSDILFARAFDFFGWTGVVAIAAGATALALAAMSRFMLSRQLEPIYVLGIAVLSASLLAPHLVARPHALVAPLLTGWCIALVRANEAGRAPPLALAGLMALWANIHGSFLFGVALAFALALEALLVAQSAAARLQRAKSWALFLGLTVLAALCTPLGWDGLTFGVRVDQMTVALSQIGEWRSPDFQKLQPLELWILIGGAFALTSGIRLPLIRAGLLLLLLHFALQHSRHADLLALVGPILIAAPLGRYLENHKAASISKLDMLFASCVRPASPLVIGFVTASLLGVVAIKSSSPSLAPPKTAAPQAAIAASKGEVHGRVLNAYEFGGYLISLGIPTFIDGRTDLYGDAFVARYLAATNATVPSALPTLLAEHDIGWTILPPQLPAVALLDHLAGWRRVYGDDAAVVHKRVE